jgi:ATP-dependent protease HslVU (ClpYQ) peptidase subunit
MTVIIALKHKGVNYIAADRRITAWPDLITDNATKIIKHNECLIWLAWDCSVDAIIQYILSANKTLHIKSIDDITRIYLKLRLELKEHGILEIWQDPMFQAIFVTDKHIRTLDFDGSIIEHKDRCSVWCGTDFAKGMLHNTKITNPEKDLKEMIKHISKYSVGVWPTSIVKVAIPFKKIVKILKKTKQTKKIK